MPTSWNSKAIEVFNKICFNQRQGSYNYYQYEIFGFTRPGIEPRTSQTRSEYSTARLLVLVVPHYEHHFVKQ